MEIVAKRPLGAPSAEMGHFLLGEVEFRFLLIPQASESCRRLHLGGREVSFSHSDTVIA